MIGEDECAPYPRWQVVRCYTGQTGVLVSCNDEDEDEVWADFEDAQQAAVDVDDANHEERMRLVFPAGFVPKPLPQPWELYPNNMRDPATWCSAEDAC